MSSESSLIAELEHAFGLQLGAEQRHQLRRYVELLEKWRSKINLTGNLSLRELLRFHFFESFWLAHHFIPPGTVWIDVGSGAGFPGLAGAIVRPEAQVTLLEPNLKKATFLKQVARMLDLPVRVWEGRGEDFPDWPSGATVSFRALTPSAQILERLNSRACRLLLLHGPDADPGPGWRLARRLQVPTSSQRWASLYDPLPG